MDAYQNVITKLDVRNFSSNGVPEDVQGRVVEAGRLAGSGKNAQHWRFILVRDKHNLQQLADASITGKWVKEASFAVVVLTDPSLGFHKIDAGRAAEDMQLAAWSEGVVSCVYTGINDDEMRKQFGFPNVFHPTIVVGFGYPAAKVTGRRKKRKPLAEIAYLEKYGKPLDRP